jgi:hypothetical protein
MYVILALASILNIPDNDMQPRRLPHIVILSTVLLLAGLSPTEGLAQQVIQRGALGVPAQVLDETGLWTTPLALSSDHDVEIYIPDVTSPAWISRNYQDFVDKGQYVLSMFTFYKTTKACETSQIGWGYADAAHLNACAEIGYRVRQASVDTTLKTVTLMMATMVDQDGNIVPGSAQRQTVVRRWIDLDPNTQKALDKATEIIAKQMGIYDAKMQRAR